VLELVQKFTGVFAMICYIPALTFCLYHVRRLDTVMETIETIHELKDIQAAVLTFSAQMDDEHGNVSLLNALSERVLCRLQLVDKFDKLIARYSSRPELVQNLAKDLVTCLEEVARVLRPASEWFHISEQEKNASSREAARLIEAAVEKNSALRLSDSHFDPAFAVAKLGMSSHSVCSAEMPQSTMTLGQAAPRPKADPGPAPVHPPKEMATTTFTLDSPQSSSILSRVLGEHR